MTTLLLHPRGGSLVKVKPNDDGTTTLDVSGVNLLTLFPTDFPPGPSSTLHQGHVEITIDENGDWTVEKVSGRTTDICAALGG
jgi:hypothetical protein